MPESVKFRFDIRLILLGFFVALFSAGIGIGGGTLLVSILMSVFGFDFRKDASTSLATIIPISFIGSGNLPDPILKIVFGIFLLIIACNYIIQEISMHFRPAVLVEKFLGKG